MKILNHKYLPVYFCGIVTMAYLSVYIVMLYTNRISPDCIADECRYISFAENLLNGFYSPPAPNINLWSGPGFPIILMPLVSIHADRSILILFNVLISIGVIIVMFKTAILFLSQSKALIISLIWSLYYPHYQEIFTVLTEPFTTLLLISFAYFITKYIQNRKKLAGLYSGIIFGFLVLTKVIFSYVLILLLFILLIFYLFKLNRKLMEQLIYVWIIAFSITLPYQLYTYHLTGKIYYFANSGGSSLYFMTSPHVGEFGEWNNTTFTANCGFSAEVPCNSEKFKQNHLSFFEYLKNLDPISVDEKLKKRSLQNIKAHPVKYLKNYINNFSRMLFNIPQSYFYQREQTIFRIIPNSFVFVFMVLGIIYSLMNYQKLPNSVLIIIIFVLSYLSIQLLVSSYPRHFNVIVPLILIWLAVVKENWIDGLRNT